MGVSGQIFIAAAAISLLLETTLAIHFIEGIPFRDSVLPQTVSLDASRIVSECAPASPALVWTGCLMNFALTTCLPRTALPDEIADVLAATTTPILHLPFSLGLNSTLSSNSSSTFDALAIEGEAIQFIISWGQGANEEAFTIVRFIDADAGAATLSLGVEDPLAFTLASGAFQIPVHLPAGSASAAWTICLLDDDLNDCQLECGGPASEQLSTIAYGDSITLLPDQDLEGTDLLLRVFSYSPGFRLGTVSTRIIGSLPLPLSLCRSVARSLVVTSSDPCFFHFITQSSFAPTQEQSCQPTR
eukprot:NODE_703_length_1968_cov_39.859302_g650_i0.p1 GENE.NODE_703_length_1968_cov_39.859302_g650_i0~~NODE_703_length_1968_cov_39.859302_g650_i0.p1  ORF type:complete len:302 (+),score=27.05 NODE_703_length_1968_cov_39.859302_g650_i0:79-984(+)